MEDALINIKWYSVHLQAASHNNEHVRGSGGTWRTFQGWHVCHLLVFTYQINHTVGSSRQLLLANRLRWDYWTVPERKHWQPHVCENTARFSNRAKKKSQIDRLQNIKYWLMHPKSDLSWTKEKTKIRDKQSHKVVKKKKVENGCRSKCTLKEDMWKQVTVP